MGDTRHEASETGEAARLAQLNLGVFFPLDFLR
jgi:hypothetical protein